VRVCPADLGRRVTVRHRLAGEPRLSDVVGTLTGWADGVLSVTRRDGTLARVAEQDVVGAKVVPPEVSAYDVQRVAEAGWPPERSAQLGDWTLRWTRGVTGRANSVRVGADPGRPLGEALAQVTAWYAGLESPPLLQQPAPWPGEATLEDLGWRVRRHTQVWTTTTAQLVSATDAGAPAGVEVAAVPGPDDQWLAMLSDEDPSTWPVYREILLRPTEVVFLAARDRTTGELMGVARASVATLPGGRSRWAGITSLEVSPAARGQGIARALTGGLARWAGDRGAGTTYLQVLVGNTAAENLYRNLGFARHHDYVYRAPDPT
jgi:GNAT superfamily N-acetyltransferase